MEKNSIKIKNNFISNVYYGLSKISKKPDKKFDSFKPSPKPLSKQKNLIILSTDETNEQSTNSITSNYKFKNISKVLKPEKMLPNLTQEKPSKLKEPINNLVKEKSISQKKSILLSDQKVKKDAEISNVFNSIVSQKTPKPLENSSKLKKNKINLDEKKLLFEKYSILILPNQKIKKNDESSKILSSILTQKTPKPLEKPSKLKEPLLKFVESILPQKTPKPLEKPKLKEPLLKSVEDKPIIQQNSVPLPDQNTPKPLEKPSKFQENSSNVNGNKKKPFSEKKYIHPPPQKPKKGDKSSMLTQKTEKPSEFKELTIKDVEETSTVSYSNTCDTHINFEALVEENYSIELNNVLNQNLSLQNQYQIPQDPIERVNCVFELFHSKAELVDYALKAPPRNTSSMEEVVQYIKNRTKDRLEKYMLAFLWVTFNIEYDTESYFSENISSGSCKADSVFKNGKSVCAGYSSIFSDFCLKLGLNSIKISGYAKGYKYIKNQTFEKTNHAWNAIELDGKWYLIDSTWGAGALNDKKQFVREFNPYYFMCPAQFFIEDHLPENDSFQFLKNKISKKQYEENYLYKLSHYFHRLYNDWKNRHVLISPTFILMHFDGEKCKNNIFTVRLKLPGKKIHTSLTSKDDQTSKETIEGATFNKEVENNEFEVKFIIPCSGNFNLNIFGGEFSCKSYDFEFAYQIFCNNFKLNKKRFPKTYSFEALYDLIEPLERDLPLSSNTVFKLKLTGYNKVAVIQNSDFSYLTLNSSTGVWEGKVKIKCKSVGLSAQKNENESYYTICKYNGV